MSGSKKGSKKTKRAAKKQRPDPGSQTGSYAHGFHEGGRSEILADYLFSGWGTVTPVRRQDDHGADLYCTLSERQGRRSVVRDYFVVQVKSDLKPWCFGNREAVRWLIEYPVPLFLATVDKKAGVLRVYHLTPRFLVAALGDLPNRLELVPGDGDSGDFVQWVNGEKYSLSAPILRVGVEELLRGDLNALRAVFEHWVRVDRENCDLVRQGLLRFRMPAGYRVNELPHEGTGESGHNPPDASFLKRGLITMAEGLECIGGQLFEQGDRQAALWAALLVDHLLRHYKTAFADVPRLKNSRVPGWLGVRVTRALNTAINANPPRYTYQGLDALIESLQEADPLKTYLAQKTL